MSLSRRDFVRTLGVGGMGALAVPAIAARGREALIGGAGTVAPWPSSAADTPSAPTMPVRLDSNENPNGPGAAALEAIRAALGEASRYPDGPEDRLRESVARLHKVAPENVILGCGSTEILRMAVHQFTSASRPLVTAAPTFEDPAGFSRKIGAAVSAVPLDGTLRLDFKAMEAASRGAGLIYLCNPNNPTATVRTLPEVKDFIARVARTEPDAAVLVDEAYYEYVDDAGYATAIPLAIENPRVVVSRTFSKVFGMAGLRVGYAVAGAATIDALTRHRLPSGVNLLGASAALATLGDKGHIEEQRRLNRDAREATRRFFEGAGYKVVPSEANFMMIDIRRDAKEFRAACRRRNVMIGRAFPPLTSHIRVTIGTMDEMRQAMDVFRRVLSDR